MSGLQRLPISYYLTVKKILIREQYLHTLRNLLVFKMFVLGLNTLSGTFVNRRCRLPHFLRILLQNATEQCITFKCEREYLLESRCLVSPPRPPNTTLWKLDVFRHQVIGLKSPTPLGYSRVSTFCRYANCPSDKNVGVKVHPRTGHEDPAVLFLLPRR